MREDGWPMYDGAENVVTLHVRKHDYYGGDVWLDLWPVEYGSQDAAVLRWSAWGGYGATALRLTRDEAAAIAHVLIECPHPAPSA